MCISIRTTLNSVLTSKDWLDCKRFSFWMLQLFPLSFHLLFSSSPLVSSSFPLLSLFSHTHTQGHKGCWFNLRPLHPKLSWCNLTWSFLMSVRPLARRHSLSECSSSWGWRRCSWPMLPVPWLMASRSVISWSSRTTSTFLDWLVSTLWLDPMRTGEQQHQQHLPHASL